MQDSIARGALRAAFAAVGSRVPVHAHSQKLMGGTGSVVVVGASQSLLAECFDLANRCEALWSRFIATSDITRANLAGGEWVAVDSLTIRLLKAMVAATELTAGDFNPTVLPDLVEAGYGASFVDSSRRTHLPLHAQRVRDWQAEIGGDEIRLPVHTTLDPGGIGKGLAADIVVEFARERGAWGALAEFGGDIVVQGDAPTEDGWVIAIDTGFSAGDGETVRLASGAIVTSSQVRRRWKKGSSIQHHLIDPRTGRSANTEVQSGTIIAGTGAQAEAISKSAFLRPPDEYLRWVPKVGAAAQIAFRNEPSRSSLNWGAYK